MSKSDSNENERTMTEKKHPFDFNDKVLWFFVAVNGLAWLSILGTGCYLLITQ